MQAADTESADILESVILFFDTDNRCLGWCDICNSSVSLGQQNKENCNILVLGLPELGQDYFGI